MVRVVDAVLPALQGLAIHLLVFERIAEHADGRDGDVAIADGIEAALAQFGQVLAVGRLPEERLEALEAQIGDRRDVLRRLAGGAPGSWCRYGWIWQGWSCDIS